MRAVLFVNDSYFAYLLAEPVLRRFHNEIGLVVLSTRNTGSALRLRSIYSRTSIQYFLYRSVVQCVSIIAGRFRGKSVAAAAACYGIPLMPSADFQATLAQIAAAGPFDIGLAFNCDQKVDENILSLCRCGVLNVHASKLPDDAGISPVLWAFARGDRSVWSTIYRMDAGIDTGPILEQREIGVRPDDTAFTLYERVCRQSGEALAEAFAGYIRGELEPRPQNRNARRTYWSWPDRRHQEMMRSSGRRFLRAKDLLRTLSGARRATAT